MAFTNINTPRAEISKKGSTLGANFTVICGVAIGRYSFVGAGAVVTGAVYKRIGGRDIRGGGLRW